MSLTSALIRSLESHPVTDADAAAVELACTYAAAVDQDPDAMPKLGPALLAVLEALGMTPAARARLAKGVKQDEPRASPLDELRARRNARQRDTPAVDTPAS